MPADRPHEATATDSPYREPVTTYPVRFSFGFGRFLTVDFINVLTLGTVLIPTVCMAD